MELSSDAALRLAISHLHEGVQVISFDWMYLYLNDTAARQGQRTRDELLGRTMMACYPGIERTEMFASLQHVMATRRAEALRNEFVYPNGTRAWFELLIEPVPDGICILSLDITEKRTLELQLQQAQRMEALGQLAGGVAHDFNNLLTGILGYCELLLDGLPPGDPRRSDVEEIRNGGEHAATLTRQLLAFGRRQQVDPQVIDVNAAVVTTSQMLQRVVGEHIEMDLRLDPSLGRVKADAGQLSQILMNLVVNARDAMPNGGKLTIGTRNVELDEHYAGTHFDVVPGPYVQLAVADTGIGMSPEVQARIFEPFFTTKEIGKGTGLGLASVYGIVRQSHGNIWVYSEPGHGTTFKVYLPCSDAAERSAEALPPERAIAGGQPATILVVEDNPALQTLIARVLRRQELEVLSAGSPDEALRLARSHGGHIDLLLSDVVMPGQSGPALAMELLRQRPTLRVIFMSGYTDEAIVRHGLLDGNAVFLQKPFTPHVLIRRVRETLAGALPSGGHSTGAHLG